MIRFTEDRLHRRFRIPFIASGALGLSGHIRVLGCTYTWLNELAPEWASKRGISFWGFVAFVHEDTQGGTLKAINPGWSVRWLKIDLSAAIRPARPY